MTQTGSYLRCHEEADDCREIEKKQVIIAEGKKTAMNLEAEGRKRVELNLGIAEQESTRKRSEGKKHAQIEMGVRRVVAGYSFEIHEQGELQSIGVHDFSKISRSRS